MIVSIRQQGGAAVMTIPAEVLRKFDWRVGSQVDLSLLEDGFTVRPTVKPRKRYHLSELLVSAEEASALADETAWAREGDAVGRELS
jgi:antitoxin ChpS